jgi:phosphohistidine phosphatase SixA
MLRGFAILCLAPLAGMPALAQDRPAEPPRAASRHWHSTQETVATLRAILRGGNVLYVRHGKTDDLATDARPVVYADCARQRNLSAAGLALSKEMGEAMRALRVPLGAVRASPYCRTMDTARLAFGRVEADESLLAFAPAKGWTMTDAAAALHKAVAGQPGNGPNLVLVAHILNAQAAFGLTPEEGETIVLRADPSHGYVVVGRITATQWGDLVRDIVVQKLDPADYAAGHSHPHPAGTPPHGHPHGAPPGHGEPRK